MVISTVTTYNLDAESIGTADLSAQMRRNACCSKLIGRYVGIFTSYSSSAVFFDFFPSRFSLLKDFELPSAFHYFSFCFTGAWQWANWKLVAIVVYGEVIACDLVGTVSVISSWLLE
jgi:hypothetical protein